MKKFKTISFVIFILLLLSVFATILVLSFTNQEFLKKAIDYVVKILDHPLPIVGVSVSVACLTIFEIFTHTSFGKAVYIKAKQENEKSLYECNGLKEQAREYYEEIAKCKNDTIAILNDISKEIKELTNEIVSVCETSPNAKIKAIGKKIKAKSFNYEEEIDKKIEDFNAKPQKTIEELIEEINELRIKFAKVEENYASE